MRPSRAGQTCSECSRSVLARGLCGLHYQRQYRNGDPNKVVSAHGMTADERLRFYGWTETSAGCWEWGGGRLQRGMGYGRVSWMSKSVTAHRLAYETWVGPIPEGLIVRHKCDNPPCINPEHLEIGTPADNARDMIERGRKVVTRGEGFKSTKLTESQVRAIRKLYSEGVSQMDLAEQFGVTNKNISLIVLGKTWRHILDSGTEVLS